MALLSAYHGDDVAVREWATRALELATRFGDPETIIQSSIRLGTADLFQGGPDARPASSTRWRSPAGTGARSWSRTR